MGTAKVPCRSEDMRVTMANLRAGRYGSQPGATIIEQRVLAMLGEPTMHALFTEFETDEFGSPVTLLVRAALAAAARDVASPRQDVQAPRGGRGAWVPRGGGQLRTPYKRCCQYCRVQLGVVDDSHEQATCPKFAAVIAAKK